MTCWKDVLPSIAIALAVACAGPAAPRREGGVAAARSDAPAPERLKRAAAEALARNEFVEAERLYAEASRLAPEDPSALVGLARVKTAVGRVDLALTLADRAVALGDGADALSARGEALARSRRFEEAARDLDRATALAPARSDAWTMLTVVQVNRGDEVEASRAFDGAVEALGRKAAVESIWPALVGLSPDAAQPQESLDRCNRSAVALLDGRSEEARHEAINGMRYSPRYAWCAANLAEATRRLGDLPRAEVLLRRAVDAFPDGLEPLRADAKSRLAAVLLDAGRPAEAVPLARAALAVRPERAGTLDVLARACDAAGDAPCARDAYARLLARPHAPAAMRARAEERLEALGAAAVPAAAK